LVLSSLRFKHLKVFITRVGTRIIKGDFHLRLASLLRRQGRLTSYKLTISALPTAPTIVLHQLTTTRTLIDACLDVVDAKSSQQVRVRDKGRVESQEPSWMTAMANLGALERRVAGSRRAVDIVVGKDQEDG
jgi:hypothetical protein